MQSTRRAPEDWLKLMSEGLNIIGTGEILNDPYAVVRFCMLQVNVHAHHLNEKLGHAAKENIAQAQFLQLAESDIRGAECQLASMRQASIALAGGSKHEGTSLYPPALIHQWYEAWHGLLASALRQLKHV